MKLALRGLLVAVVAAVATGPAAVAHSSTPLVTVPDSVVFWNPHDGLLAAGQCRHAKLEPCKRGVVERTSDGGRTYHVVHRTPSIVNLQTVGTLGAIASTWHGRSWRTLDGGQTWHRIASGPAVDWLNPDVGIRVRSYSVHNRVALAMLVTHDGGQTWHPRPSPCAKADVAFSAFADLVSPTSWWVACTGQGGAGNEEKAIYHSRNAGRTWEAGAATTLPHQHGGIQEYGYPAGLAFAPGGWGLLTETRGTLYVTRDGGKRFRAEPKVARPEVDFAGGAAAFRGGIGYVLLTDFPGARLIETRDFGRTWSVVRRWRR
jgi:photosystem II stability/assembly factor-like uncharacterized protein